MQNYKYTRTNTRRRTRKIVVAILLIASMGAAATLGYRSLAASFMPIASPYQPASPSTVASPDVLHPSDHQGAPDVSDGVVPDGVTIFDDQYPAVSNLNSGLLSALRQAANDAAGFGITFYVNSGWRSPAYQEQLLHQAVAQYGSKAAAARWVATPTTSPHVSGNAIDLGQSAADSWLSKHGTRYGLCQIYRNEPWHFELRPEATSHGCPAMYADPTHDPRMQ